MVTRKEDTSKRVARRKYEEKNKELRKEKNANFQTMIPRELFEEINACSFVSLFSTFPPTNSQRSALALLAGLWQIKNLSLAHISAATTSIIFNLIYTSIIFRKYCLFP